MKLKKPKYNQAKIKKRLKAEADKLFKALCFQKYGTKCELCGSEWKATAHHFYYRGSVPHLKFDRDNGIILCGRCHSRLHFKDPKLVESQIIKVRGNSWLKALEKKAQEEHSSFQTLAYYKETIERLKQLLNN